MPTPAGAWRALTTARDLTHKILADQADPKAGDRMRSVVDTDMRCGKHGDWYDGYLLDVMMDPDSEILTAMAYLPANGNEAADAAELVRQEETAHGNDIQALSIDSVAFLGPVLEELQDPEGPALDLYVPPIREQHTACFAPEEFKEDAVQKTLTCPAGRSTAPRAESLRYGLEVPFPRRGCAGCPLRDRCIKNVSPTTGRTVIKNDYEEQYRAMRTKAQTAEYAAVRHEHPKIERKLSELVRRHGARRAVSRRWKGADRRVAGGHGGQHQADGPSVMHAEAGI